MSLRLPFEPDDATSKGEKFYVARVTSLSVCIPVVMSSRVRPCEASALQDGAVHAQHSRASAAFLHRYQHVLVFTLGGSDRHKSRYKGH